MHVGTVPHRHTEQRVYMHTASDCAHTAHAYCTESLDAYCIRLRTCCRPILNRGFTFILHQTARILHTHIGHAYCNRLRAYCSSAHSQYKICHVANDIHTSTGTRTVMQCSPSYDMKLCGHINLKTASQASSLRRSAMHLHFRGAVSVLCSFSLELW
jgi:hypothetical protein